LTLNERGEKHENEETGVVVEINGMARNWIESKRVVQLIKMITVGNEFTFNHGN